MCGRFGQISNDRQYSRKFGLTAPLELEFEPNVNTDIGSYALIATADKELRPSMFGYSPPWGDKLMYLFNARSEGDYNLANEPGYNGPMGIFEKPAFRQAIKTQRAVVPVDYFVEGPEKEKLKKPYIVKREDEEPFLLAGLWGEWHNRLTGESIHTFSIITTAHNALLGKVGHHRCPLVLPASQMDTWLHPATSREQLSQLMVPFADAEFLAYPVDPQMGKRNTSKSPNNSPVLLEPIGPELRA